MVTVDELPEFWYMLRHRMTSKLKHTEAVANTPFDREDPMLTGRVRGWNFGIGGRTRQVNVTIVHVTRVTPSSGLNKTIGAGKSNNLAYPLRVSSPLDSHPNPRVARFGVVG